MHLGGKKSHIYFMCNQKNNVLYIGVTSNLIKRVYQHKLKIFKGFTQRYSCTKLVYYEEFNRIEDAIAREKQLKSGNRRRKNMLVDGFNPEWKDLSEGWLFYFDSIN
jgi:putative endonuclease